MRVPTPVANISKRERNRGDTALKTPATKATAAGAKGCRRSIARELSPDAADLSRAFAWAGVSGSDVEPATPQ